MAMSAVSGSERNLTLEADLDEGEYLLYVLMDWKQ